MTEENSSNFDDDHATGPTTDSTITDTSPHARKPTAPGQIGPYKILEILGQGGMGTVYLAEQTQPVHRRVALKVIKPGMDSKAVIARFEAERQALAMMDHPCVAKVLDAGTTERGLPYFVMEHVPGVPITEHCDRQRLGIKARLDLFMRVCQAVQHAHQKGIIHRDIKPSNILVSVRDGQATPKVIDFGVAKAISRHLTEKTLFTEQGQLIGTPEYMSPEQAEMTAQDIDTRSDIYSLGVLLYELLTGVLPFDSRSLRQAAFGEIQRIIREVDPPKPSTRLSSLTEPGAKGISGGAGVPPVAPSPRGGEGRDEGSPGSAGDIAHHRRADPRSLIRQVRGDLDWIVMKALEKDRARRYETANGLAADIQRHLSDEPVLAGPPSAAYRISKFVRRNRGGVTAAVIVLVVLLAGITGITGTTIGLIQARAARDAEAEQRTIAENEADNAKNEADNAKAINDFLTKDLLAAVAPSATSGKGKDVLMRDVLDEASRKIETAAAEGGRFADKPLIEASIRATLGVTYRLLGKYAAAEPHMDRALLLRRRELGEESPGTLDSMNNLAILYLDQGRYDEAEPLLVKTLEIEKRVLGEEHPNTLNSMNNLAILYWRQGRYDEAVALDLKTLQIRRRVLGEEHPDTLGTMSNLANLYRNQGRYDEAEALSVKTLEIKKGVLGEEHPDTLTSINNLGALLLSMGKLNEALSYYKEALEGRRRVLGDDHPDTLTSINNMGYLLRSMGKLDEALPYLQEALEGRRRVLGDDHPDTLGSINNMGRLLNKMGKLDEALPYYKEALEGNRRVLGDDHPDTLRSINNMVTLLMEMGKLDEALPYCKEALEASRRVLGDDHPSTLNSINNMGSLLKSMGKLDEAQPYFQEALEGNRRVLGDDHPYTLTSINNMGGLLLSMGKYDEALPYFQEALEGRHRVLGDDHPDTLFSVMNMGGLLNDLKKYDEALTLLEASEAAARRVWTDANRKWLGDYLAKLGVAQAGVGHRTDAETTLLEAYKLLSAGFGEQHKQTLKAAQALVDLYTAWDAAEPGKGNDAKAEQWRAKLPKKDSASPESPDAGEGKSGKDGGGDQDSDSSGGTDSTSDDSGGG